MKTFIATIFFCAICMTAQSQTRKKTDSLSNPNVYRTDSARSGNKLYEGGKGKGRSQGDTLAPQQQNGRGERNAAGTRKEQEPTSPGTATASSSPKYPK